MAIKNLREQFNHPYRAHPDYPNSNLAAEHPRKPAKLRRSFRRARWNKYATWTGAAFTTHPKRHYAAGPGGLPTPVVGPQGAMPMAQQQPAQSFIEP